MRLTEKHIQHFNLLNGNRISKKALVAFHTMLKKDIDSKRIDAHVPGGIECLDIEKRLATAITKINGHVMEVRFKPIKIKTKVAVVNTANGPEVKLKKKQAPKEIEKKVEKVVKVNKHETPKPAINKRHVGSNLNGVVDASALKQLQFKRLELTGQYKKDLHRLYSDTLIMFWGSPGSGKTVWLLKFAQYLAEALGLKVLYLANEEWGRSTLTEKIQQFNIGHANLKMAKDFNAMKAGGFDLSDFDAVFMDTVQTLGIDLNAFKKLVEDNPGRIYVSIIQSTKEGDFRGGKDWEHEMDIAGEIKKRKLILRKNRLDPNNSEKANKLLVDEIVEEKTQAQRIKQLVKDQTKDTTQKKIIKDPTT